MASSTSTVRVQDLDEPGAAPVLHFPLAHVERELLAQLADPPPRVEALRGHVAFDTSGLVAEADADADRLRVELVDAVGSWLDAWVRFRDVPPDPSLHAGLMAQFTGHLSIAAALRPHEGVGQDAAHRTISTAINAIGLSVHAEVRADRWMLYRHHSTFAGDGMTHSECRVHDQHGRLSASFTVDAMVRPFRGARAGGAGSGAVDERTAL